MPTEVRDCALAAWAAAARTRARLATARCRRDMIFISDERAFGLRRSTRFVPARVRAPCERLASNVGQHGREERHECEYRGSRGSVSSLRIAYSSRPRNIDLRWLVPTIVLCTEE